MFEGFFAKLLEQKLSRIFAAESELPPLHADKKQHAKKVHALQDKGACTRELRPLGHLSPMHGLLQRVAHARPCGQGVEGAWLSVGECSARPGQPGPLQGPDWTKSKMARNQGFQNVNARDTVDFAIDHLQFRHFKSIETPQVLYGQFGNFFHKNPISIRTT